MKTNTKAALVTLGVVMYVILLTVFGVIFPKAFAVFAALHAAGVLILIIFAVARESFK